MARTRRQYGSGCLLTTRRGFAIRWQELEIGPDGTRRRVLRYQALGRITRKEAGEILAQKIAAAASPTPQRSRVSFQTVARDWEAHVVSLQEVDAEEPSAHREQTPAACFGDRPLSEVTRQEIQVFVTHLMQEGYAPKSVDHIHDTLSAVLRTAVYTQVLDASGRAAADRVGAGLFTMVRGLSG